MDYGTSIGKFNGLTTAGEGVCFDVGALSRVAATPPSQMVLATPRRQDQRPNQMVRLLVRAARASRPRSATGRRSHALRQVHRFGLSRNTGALGGNDNALICNPNALSAGPEILSFDPDALSFDPDALRFDTGALRFDPETLSFDRDALSFEVFHQRRGSNGLISSNLRGIASKPSKFAFSQTLNIQHSTLN
jgi:hypothetical protein